MGEFDRQQSAPQKSDARKTILALVLGVVLVGLVANWYLNGPSNANAAPATTGAIASSLPLDDDMSPPALAKLQADLNTDPTRSLLLPEAAVSVPTAPSPRNPFRMAPGWQARLKPESPVVAADPQLKNPPRTIEPQPVGPKPEPASLRPGDYKLQSLWIHGGQRSAMINSREVRVGDVVGKARVVEIRDNSVILQNTEFPDGPKVEITMPGLNPS